MQNRFIPFYKTTIQSTFYKATQVETTNSFNSLGGYEQFVVLADQLHGDKVTVNYHAFRKLVMQEYYGSFRRSDSSEDFTQHGVIASFTTYDDAAPASWSNLYNQCLSDLYEQLRSGGYGSGLDYSVDIAEANQVKKLLSQFQKVNSFIRSFHPKNWGRKWLEYQYGWRPLINTAYGTFDAIMHRRLYSLTKVIGKSRDRFYSEKSFRDTYWPGSYETVHRDARYRAKLCCLFQIENNTRQMLSGYTSLNPASIAWELTPYSFVVDWFIDIGGYLKNLESAILFAQGFHSGWIVYGYRDKQDGFISGSKVVGGQLSTGAANSFIVQAYKRREAVAVYPLPVLPGFKANLGWQRLISGASLLGNFLGKGSTPLRRII